MFSWISNILYEVINIGDYVCINHEFPKVATL